MFSDFFEALKDEIKEAKNAILRGTLLGSLIGVIPGGGSILSSFLSYIMEKRIAKDKMENHQR